MSLVIGVCAVAAVVAFVTSGPTQTVELASKLAKSPKGTGLGLKLSDVQLLKVSETADSRMDQSGMHLLSHSCSLCCPFCATAAGLRWHNESVQSERVDGLDC